jgi:hypothetical protein
MRNIGMDEKQIRAFIKAIERIIGNPIEADPEEFQSLFGDSVGEIESAKLVYDIASRAAQKHRLAGTQVPDHVAQALKSMKAVLGESGDEGASAIVESALRPFAGPVEEVRCNFRNMKIRTQSDRALLEKLAEEVKKDWTKDKNR